MVYGSSPQKLVGDLIGEKIGHGLTVPSHQGLMPFTEFGDAAPVSVGIGGHAMNRALLDHGLSRLFDLRPKLSRQRLGGDLAQTTPLAPLA